MSKNKLNHNNLYFGQFRRYEHSLILTTYNNPIDIRISDGYCFLTNVIIVINEKDGN